MKFKLKYSSILSCVYFVAILSLLFIFSINSLSLSGRKPFWADEVHSLSNTVREHDYKQIVINGAAGQGSPSPLDYLIIKAVDKYKNTLNYLNLQPHQYFRVYNLIFLWVAMSLLSYLVFKKSQSNLIRFAFLVALTTFLFNGQIAYFASEMRPYSIWTSLSFLFLFLLTIPSVSQIVLTSTVILLALTTTASIYQITSFIISLLIVAFLFKIKKLSTLTWLSIPLLASYLINFYYILHIGNPNYPTPTWEYFFQFWSDYIPIVLLGIALSIHHYLKKDKQNLLASITGTCWLLFGPLSFYMTQNKGFFFTPRQYLYYFPILSLFLYQFIVLITNWPIRYKKLTLVILVLSFSLFSLIIKNTNTAIPQAIKSLFHQYPISIPVNYSKIEATLPDQIPSKFELLAKDSGSSFDPIALFNFQIWWQYVQNKYPEDQFSRSDSVLVVRDRDINFELVNIKP